MTTTSPTTTMTTTMTTTGQLPPISTNTVAKVDCVQDSDLAALFDAGLLLQDKTTLFVDETTQLVLMHTYIHTYTHIHTHIYTHIHIHTYKHTHTHTHTHTYTHCICVCASGMCYCDHRGKHIFNCNIISR